MFKKAITEIDSFGWGATLFLVVLGIGAIALVIKFIRQWMGK